MFRASTLLVLALTAVGCAAPTSETDPTAETASAATKTSWRKLRLDKATKAELAACGVAASKTEDYFYCPMVDRFRFSGAITTEVLERFAEKRNAEVYETNATIEAAVQRLRARANGQVASVQDATIRAQLEGHMNALEAKLRATPGNRIVLASGYWAPSVNSDSVYVIDDASQTLTVFEHGDTDG